MFTLTIDTDNDSFAGDTGDELTACLLRVTAKASEGSTGNILDTNGNTVGSWTWTA